MNGIAWMFAGGFAAFALIQLFSCVHFVRAVRNYRSPQSTAKGHVSIFMSIRGADPSLRKSLLQMMNQDHPSYDIRVVVDSEADPSMAIVQNAIRDNPSDIQVSVQTLVLRDGCGRKCAAISQLASQLDETTDYVVIADSDIMPTATWLSELTAPLADPSVGATHGNRWFWPRRELAGSLVRYLWNAAAVVFMHMFKVPWGGSLAIRARLIQESCLEDEWSKSMVEDVTVYRAMRQLRMQTRFVPSLMIVNDEDCTLPFCFDFIKRQLMWVRLYHPNWWAAILATCVIMFWVASGALLPLTLLTLGNSLSAAKIIAVSFGLYLGTLAVMVAILEWSIRDLMRRRRSPVHRMSWLSWARMALVLPVAWCIHFGATILATFARRVVWRGVTYVLHGPGRIEVVSDYAVSSRAQSNLSI